MKATRYSQGFGLIELMIVVAIFAILAMVVVPSYTQMVLKNQRVDAREMLLEVAREQERNLYTVGSYTNDLTDLGYDATPLSDEGHYRITVTALVNDAVNGVNSYTLTATAVGSQVGDADCSTFSLSSIGLKSSAPQADCW
ncbi:MAG: prepilin-type N-terminal cleavage/methylation domain-containing protein [Gammaproteobacteria bacterium]|nr:prepilin-type N-terminal cleavage/methylation domain-containing protein [Gammaproteobacteria bacterium]MCF6230795.1 prepilin-type N-terminal cleavage/methylation domain-containing protein [Gammaproteobacteria bacterium]